MKNKIKKKGAIRDSRKGVSAQVYGDYNIKSEFKQILIEKDSETRNRICELIKKSMILGFLGEN